MEEGGQVGHWDLSKALADQGGVLNAAHPRGVATWSPNMDLSPSTAPASAHLGTFLLFALQQGLVCPTQDESILFNELYDKVHTHIEVVSPDVSSFLVAWASDTCRRRSTSASSPTAAAATAADVFKLDLHTK